MTKHIDKELQSKLEIFQDYTASWGYPMNQEAHKRGLNNAVSELKKLISDEVIKVLDEVEKDVKAKYERAGKGSRPSFSRDTETKGEYYSRVQGFKSACLNSLSAINEARKDYNGR